MKIVIELPEEKYEWIKTNNPNADPNSIVGAVANGKPYDKVIEEVTELLENEWGYEGMKDDVARIMEDGVDCLDEDAKQASIPYTYNASQSEKLNNDWDTDEPQDPEEETDDTEPNEIIDQTDGIADPTYINGIVDSSDFGIFPWGNS